MRLQVRQTGFLTDRQTDRQTDRRTDRQTDRKTDRQTDRQTDRKTDRQTERNQNKTNKTKKHNIRPVDRRHFKASSKYLHHKLKLPPFFQICGN